MTVNENVQNMQNVQNIPLNIRAVSQRETEKADEIRQIRTFSNPKRVVKKTMAHIFISQLFTALVIGAVLFIIKLAFPSLFDALCGYIAPYIGG